MSIGRENIINILMHRDGITREEADNLVTECKEALEAGNYDAIYEYLALEDDYIFDILL